MSSDFSLEKLAELGLPTSFGSTKERSGPNRDQDARARKVGTGKPQGKWMGFGKRGVEPEEKRNSNQTRPNAHQPNKPSGSLPASGAATGKSSQSAAPKVPTNTSANPLSMLSAYADDDEDEEEEEKKVNQTQSKPPLAPVAATSVNQSASSQTREPQRASSAHHEEEDDSDFGPAVPTSSNRAGPKAQHTESEDDDDSDFGPAAPPAVTIKPPQISPPPQRELTIQEEQDFGRGSIKRVRGGDGTSLPQESGFGLARPGVLDDEGDYSDEADDEAQSKQLEEMYQTKLREMLPTTHEADMRLYSSSGAGDYDGSRVGPVTALAVDHSGTRVAAGTASYDVKLFDFTEMDSRMLPFRAFVPSEGYPVKHLEWNPAYSTSIQAAPEASSLLLVVTGATEGQVFSREGSLKTKFARGYPYVRDLSATDGHKAPCTGGAWHPKQYNYCITSSEDGSIRQWDLVTASKASIGLMKVRPRPGKRAVVTACCYSKDGNSIAGASLDGAIHIWDSRPGAKFTFTSIDIEAAHASETWTSSLLFAPHNDKVLLSRGGDHTLKVWDLRNPIKPTCVREGLWNAYDTTNMAFSPDGRFLLTGSSSYERVFGKISASGAQEDSTLRDAQIALRVRNSFEQSGDHADEEEEEQERDSKPAKENANAQQKHGKLHIFQTTLWTPLQEISLEAGSAISTTWNERTNQIYVGCSNGVVKALYAPGKSRGGAAAASARTARQKDFSEFVDYTKLGEIITPLAQGAGQSRVRRPGVKPNELASAKPIPPPSKNSQGYIPQGIQHQFLKNLVHKTKLIANEDPREALFRYADAPKYYTAAYDETQPVPIFREDVNEVEVELKGKGSHKQGGKDKLDD